MMDCKCQEGFKVSLFVSHLLVLFCPVFYFTVSIKPTASSNYNTVIVLGLTSAAKRQKTQRTKARKGKPAEKEPPTGSPKWALSDEWREIMEM